MVHYKNSLFAVPNLHPVNGYDKKIGSKFVIDTISRLEYLKYT